MLAGSLSSLLPAGLSAGLASELPLARRWTKESDIAPDDHVVAADICKMGWSATLLRLWQEKLRNQGNEQAPNFGSSSGVAHTRAAAGMQSAGLQKSTFTAQLSQAGRQCRWWKPQHHEQQHVVALICSHFCWPATHLTCVAQQKDFIQQLLETVHLRFVVSNSETPGALPMT